MEKEKHALNNLNSQSVPDVFRGYTFQTKQARSRSVPPPRPLKETKVFHKTTPFHLEWVHGFNMEVPVINLNKNLQTFIFYAASNYGVIYDWKIKKYHFLQGHKNCVAFIAKDNEGNFLVTADSGEGNMIVIWDSTFVPRRTIVDPHEGLSIAMLAFSPDAKYLITLAYGNDLFSDGGYGLTDKQNHTTGTHKPGSAYHPKIGKELRVSVCPPKVQQEEVKFYRTSIIFYRVLCRNR